MRDERAAIENYPALTSSLLFYWKNKWEFPNSGQASLTDIIGLGQVFAKDLHDPELEEEFHFLTRIVCYRLGVQLAEQAEGRAGRGPFAKEHQEYKAWQRRETMRTIKEGLERMRRLAEQKRDLPRYFFSPPLDEGGYCETCGAYNYATKERG